LRITKYHALPSTSVLVGKLNGEVVSTVTVVLDSPLGLPADSQWDLSELRKKAPRIAEISALTIRKDLQKRRGKILMPLCVYMFKFVTRYAGVDLIVAATTDSVRDFYRSYLLFEPVGNGKPVTYDFVKGVLANAQYLDCRTSHDRYQSVYGREPDHFNLFKYAFQTEFSEFKFPAQMPGQCTSPALSPRAGE
jgi:hypothetical protein